MKDNYFWCFGNTGPYSCFLLGFTEGTVNLIIPGQCVLLKKTLETVLWRRNTCGDYNGSTAAWAVYSRALQQLWKCDPQCLPQSQHVREVPASQAAAWTGVNIYLTKEGLLSHSVTEMDPSVHLPSNLWISIFTFLVYFRIILTVQFPLTKSGSCFMLLSSSQRGRTRRLKNDHEQYFGGDPE